MRKRMLKIVVMAMMALATVGFGDCGNNNGPSLPSGFTLANGVFTMLPKPETCHLDGQTVWICEGKLYSQDIEYPILTSPCLGRVYLTMCASSMSEAKKNITGYLFGLIDSQKKKYFNQDRVNAACGDTGQKSWTPPPPDSMPGNDTHRVPHPHPEDVDAGISTDPPSTYPADVEDPYSGDNGVCQGEPDDNTDWTEEDRNPAPMCTPASPDSCAECAAQSCCSQKTACDKDSVPGMPGSCGCWSACELAGFTVEQCGAPVDPSGPSSCGAMDGITTNYEACLHVNCPSCGPGAATPIGVTVGYIGAASGAR